MVSSYTYNLSWMDPRHVTPLFTFCSLFQMASYGLLATGTISYDAFGQRIRVRNIVMDGNQTINLDQLMLFQQVYNTG